MRNYEDAEGKKHSAVSIVQSKFDDSIQHGPVLTWIFPIGNIEVLKRGTPSEEQPSE
jgi:hypothetical protein